MIEITKVTNPREEILYKAQREAKLEGKLEGRLELAQKFAQKYDIDEVVEISGLTKEEILKGNKSK